MESAVGMVAWVAVPCWRISRKTTIAKRTTKPPPIPINAFLLSPPESFIICLV
jgi:hypothetical protein